MWVQSLGREDPLEKGMATHSSFLECEMGLVTAPLLIRLGKLAEHLHIVKCSKISISAIIII